MHEWALAESVLKTVKDRKDIAKKSVVEVLFGELQDIDEEIFSFAMGELKKQYPGLENTKFKIVREKAEFECVSCGKKFSLEDSANTAEEKENIHFVPEMAKAFMKCPACKSPDFEIVKGRGINLRIVTGGKE